MTQPEVAGDIETLTQRYWECMFSRMVMVGHAPQELVDFIGYNPVIELRDDISAEELIADVLENIEIYQSLVDKNRETAEKLGSWNVRMKWLMNELDDLYTLNYLYTKTFLQKRNSLIKVAAKIKWVDPIHEF